MCYNVSSNPPCLALRAYHRSADYQVQDGRYHTVCGHFIAMSTRVQDCLRPDCLFSQRHAHPTGTVLPLRYNHVMNL